MTALYVAMGRSFCLPHSVAVSDLGALPWVVHCCVFLGPARIFCRVWHEQSASCFVWI